MFNLFLIIVIIIISFILCGSNYIEKFARDNKNVTVVEVTKPIRKNRQHFPYNLYLNEVYPHIKSGWNIILNDDTYFSNENALSLIANKIVENGINNTNYLYLWNCNKLGKICPKASSGFKQGDVHLSSFAFHSSKYEKTIFPNKNCQKLEDELYIINNLLNTLKCIYINETLTTTDNLGEGLRKDNELLKPKIKVKINFNTQNSEHIFDKNESPDKISLSLSQKEEINNKEEEEINDEEEEINDEEEINNEEEIININSEKLENSISSENKKIITDSSEIEEINDEEEEINEEEINENENENEDERNENEDENEIKINSNLNSNEISSETSNILSQLVQLLNQNHNKIYILTDTHIKSLASCFYESVEYEKKSEQLVNILENNYFQLKTNELNKKLRNISLENSSLVNKELSVNNESNIISPSIKKNKLSNFWATGSYYYIIFKHFSFNFLSFRYLDI
jgi:hypothetical protein